MAFINKNVLDSFKAAYQPLTKAEELIYIQYAKKGCKKSRDKIFNSQIPLIIKTAAKYSNDENELDTLMTESFFAINDAINVYNNENFRFITIFFYHLRNRFNTAIRQNVLVNTPIVNAEKKEYKEFIKKGNNPEEFQWKTPKAKISQIDETFEESYSSKILYEDSDKIESNVFDIIDNIHLSNTERTIIKQYYNENKSYQEIADSLKVSRQNISLIHIKLKNKLSKNKLIKEQYHETISST